MTMIYALTNRSGIVRYVGQTTMSMRDRLSAHISAARSQRRPPAPVARWIRREGFRHVGVITIAADVGAFGDEIERHYISYFVALGARLCNRTVGGKRDCALTYEPVMPPASRRRIASTVRRNWQDPDLREKQSRAMRGIPKSSEHRAKLSAALKGRPWSAARRAAQEAA